MTRWQQSFHTFEKNYIGYCDVPNFVMSFIKNNETKNRKANEKLAGHIKKEYYIDNVSNEVEEFFIQKAFEQPNILQIQDINVLNKDCPIMLKTLWINYQKKYEFNPIHDHAGVLSFIIFVKIPYNLEDEENLFLVKDKLSSKLNFINISANGKILTTPINVDKSFENKMLMFPASLKHCVYPFYTSDNYRITVSGNLVFKTN